LNEIRTIEVSEHVGKVIRLRGWLHNVRRLGGVSFIVLRDGWGTIQAVTEDEADLAPIVDMALGSVISLTGQVVANPQAAGGLELQQPSLEIITSIIEAPPLALNKRQLNTALPTLLDHAVIANRHPVRRAVFRLHAGVMSGFRKTLSAMHFTEVQTPKIVASSTESGANVFKIDYFGRPAFLAQSPQFYKQIMVGVFERVFEVGPVFRAEPHDTTRHVNEYVSLDVEFGFIEDTLR
jgi:nondiscriminating aspartyl-tRNA synthetase